MNIHSQHRPRSFRSTFLFCLVTFTIGLLVILHLLHPASDSTSTAAAYSLQLPSPLEHGAGATEPDVKDGAVRSTRNFTAEELVNIRVYDRVNRSVVNINTKASTRDPFFMFQETTEGSGSGSVIDQEGHILTNYHVIAGAQQVGVTLADGDLYDATLVGADPQNDIAIVKIDAPREALTPVEFGDSSDLRVGQRIFAIGNPFGLERTLTTGIISSLNRTLPAKKKGTYTKGIIQIDAALNQGNSGGPLLDSQGLLVGMNTAIASSTGQNTGVGFSIPVNTIRRVVPELIRFGKVIRADLGIAMTFTTNRGLGIAVVAPNSPAEAAGLRGIRIVVEQRRQGQYILESRRRDFDYADRILAIDAKAINSLDDLQSYLDTKKPGDRVKLHILRGETEIDVVVQLDVEE